MARPKIARPHRASKYSPIAGLARAELDEAAGELAAAREAAGIAYAATGAKQNQAFCELFTLLAQLEASLCFAGMELAFPPGHPLDQMVAQ